ncbi:PREDICTED: NAD(P)H-quinone oxidoreductase subunit U, chloroplastic [Fragaria vesca subsp. vesca]|uniref:NAD(P)H-quinone oxidoreductase subunit U, chloroplastic n=1 Tax=Fragaria vesca subsp. vesca TaxID=101020 RepID=UPI0002C2E302|nr:PREDICTED: NAD(P)H-quinone oxidoreductase subunit U, chloroplastic [Fragaria vesca subsp. vesca]
MAVSSSTSVYITQKTFRIPTPKDGFAFSNSMTISFAPNLRKFCIRSSGSDVSAAETATATENDGSSIEVPEESPSLISALNVERALRGIPITDVNHYGRLGLQRGCTSDQIRAAYKTKLDELKSQGLEEEELNKKLEPLKESYTILSSADEKRLYDWSLGRTANPDTYLWPFEVETTRATPDTPPPVMEPEDFGPTRLVGYVGLGWIILSLVLSIALNRGP